MAKIERNQPCPCGSGKKYKKCCLLKETSEVESKANTLDVLIADGYKALEEDQIQKACDTWMDLWTALKKQKDGDIKNIQSMDKAFSKKVIVQDWCQDVEIQLGRAGAKDCAYHQKRIEFCKEFCLLFPETDSLVLFNMKRAIAESHFGLGDISSGETQFNELIKEFPRNVWGYITWGDMYYKPLHSSVKRDFAKAENLYQTALRKEKKDSTDKKNIMEKSIATERLEELSKERVKKT